MKIKITTILNEMLSFGNKSKLKILKKAHNTLELSDFSSTIFFILQWNRTVVKSTVNSGKYYQNEYLFNKELLNVTYEKNKRFFDLCPEILEIFTLHHNKITFNKDLTDSEKQEIREYIAERFNPPILNTLKRPSK